MKTYQVIEGASSYPVSLTEAKLHLKVDTTADDTLITNLIISATQVSEEYTNRFFINTVIEQTCSDFAQLKTLFKSKVGAVANVKYYPNATSTIPSTITLVNGGSGYATGVNTNLRGAGGNGTGIFVNATADINGVITSVELNVAGSGYVIDNTITIPGGNNNATFKITSLGSTENLVLLDTTIYDTQLQYEPSQIQLADGKSFPAITKRNDAVVAKYTVGYGSSASDVPHIIKQAIL